MNDQRQERLMRAARRVPAVAPSEDFCDDVLRAIRREQRLAPAARSLADQLLVIFPVVAAAALAVIVGVAAFEYFTNADFVTQLTEASDQWLLPLDWL